MRPCAAAAGCSSIFDSPARLGSLSAPGSERARFAGEDDCGTRGRCIVVNGPVNERTRIAQGQRRYEIAPAAGGAVCPL